ncbi:estradiol 17-beta-dehydrogenase 2 isoform X3 [Alligator sinensis]|uniref:Estradiol 17-beta-dehydrogenase 2 isoform X3 n=1 Tax=Alligator sinensis TaxID=38654 RepID=A0A3Q0GY80_ALLSI|nr:estradiol 17-beta-dehydrogenase 2 isoform X3 [Alligator sinensis]
MGTYISKADTSVALLYLSVTAVFGGTVFYKARKKKMEKANTFVCGLLLLSLEILCFAMLRSYAGLLLFSGACLISYICLPVRSMLPVDNKAVLITGLWGIINNAGVLGFAADGELLPMSAYRQCMDVNFFGAVEVSKMFLPLLRKSQGRLVNMSSMAGGVPMPRLAAYGASKAALSMFSGVMRQELSKWGIKVAVVHPSGFRTCIQGTPELWDKQEKHLMENLMPDVKTDYGEDYILALKNFLLHMPSSCGSDLSPLLDDVLDALLAKSPHGLYTPGKNAYLALCIFCYFPLWFYDFFIGKSLCVKILPRALRGPESKSKNT